MSKDKLNVKNRNESNTSGMDIKLTIKNVFEHIKNDSFLFWSNISLGLLTGFLQLLAPLYIAKILDSLSNGIYEIKKNIIILAIIYLSNTIFIFILSFNVNKLSYRVSNAIRQSAFEHLTKLPISFYDRADHGDIISRLTNDVQAVALAMQQVFRELFSGLIVLIGSIILMYNMQAIVATIVVFLTPFSYFITRSISLGANKLFLKQSKFVGQLQGYAEEKLNGQKIIKAFGAEIKNINEFNKINNDLKEVGQKAQLVSSLTNPATRLVNNITYVVVGVLSSMLAALGYLSIGQISAFLNYALQYAKPVNEITLVMTQVQQGIASAQRIFQLLNIDKEIDESSLQSINFKNGDIKFDSLNFSYVESMPLIKNFTMKINAGQKIAIVGPTGAGKTTLVNLLMRFYEPNTGAIYVDEQNISYYKKESVRDKYGMVLQDTWLLQASVYDNISYGKTNAKPEEVYAAAKKAQAHDFILQLENGYDTKLKNTSENLSTGQKQLLTIARVFISEPEMLILDEATSDIDTRTEVLVQSAFEKLMEGKTSFIIAHRLSTIIDADLILVMNKGDVVEIGNHNDLIAKKGFYYNLYNSQFNN